MYGVSPRFDPFVALARAACYFFPFLSLSLSLSYTYTKDDFSVRSIICITVPRARWLMNEISSCLNEAGVCTVGLSLDDDNTVS